MHEQGMCIYYNSFFIFKNVSHCDFNATKSLTFYQTLTYYI